MLYIFTNLLFDLDLILFVFFLASIYYEKI